MLVIKKQSKQTYTNKDGNDKHYYNYYLQLDNGKRFQIACRFKEDYRTLDAIAIYE